MSRVLAVRYACILLWHPISTELNVVAGAILIDVKCTKQGLIFMAVRWLRLLCQQVMLKGRVVANMMPSLCYASGEGLTQPLTVISRLVLVSPAFAQQFLQAHGLEAPILNRSPTALTISTSICCLPMHVDTSDASACLCISHK